MKTVVVGEVVKRSDRGRHRGRTWTETVKEPCAVKDRGNWYCVDCDRILRPISDDPESHDRKGNKLAWACFDHGLEVP
jgi:hypothetical protein